MKFCPKDGAMLVPKKDPKKGVVLSCPICAYMLPTSGDIKITQEVQSKETVEVVEQDSDQLSQSITDAVCEKCGNDKAYWWLVQTRASDEPATKFLKCTKCKHTWRDYS
ncbi:MAG: transcription factor S [Candidatus Woesearchaeota archaeon]